MTVVVRFEFNVKERKMVQNERGGIQYSDEKGKAKKKKKKKTSRS